MSRRLRGNDAPHGRIALSAVTQSVVPPLPPITVVMPVYNGADTLQQSLALLLAMRSGDEIFEIIVVDDGSDDDTRAIAAAAGVKVVASGGRLGPGGARNVGAARAAGEILWFVDADVVVHADGARILIDALQRTGAAAVFGTYDDDPPARNFFSQYKNLIHRYRHLRAGGEVDSFWAGCGAIRKQAFSEAGGFDAEKYPHSSIEDIELGFRLRHRGLRIWLERALLATHLKVWRLPNLLHTEVCRRALPWSRLIVEHGWWPDTLNLERGERFRAVLCAACLSSILPALLGMAPLWLPLVLLASIVVANRDLLVYFAERRGTLFAIGGVAYHQLYYLYSIATLAYCLAANRWHAVRRRFDRREGTA